jgi:hypothetical protein
MAEAEFLSTYARALAANGATGDLIQSAYGVIVGNYEDLYTAIKAEKHELPVLSNDILARAKNSPLAPLIKEALKINTLSQCIEQNYLKSHDHLQSLERELKNYEMATQQFEPASEEDEQWQQSKLNEIKMERQAISEDVRWLDKLVDHYEKNKDQHKVIFEAGDTINNHHQDVAHRVINKLNNEGYEISHAVQHDIQMLEDIKSLKERFVEARLSDNLFDELTKSCYDKQGNFELDWQTYAQLKLILARSQLSNVMQGQTVEEMADEARDQFKQDSKSQDIKALASSHKKVYQKLSTELQDIRQHHSDTITQLSKYKNVDPPKALEIKTAKDYQQNKIIEQHTKKVQDIEASLQSHNISYQKAAFVEQTYEGPGI